MVLNNIDREKLALTHKLITSKNLVLIGLMGAGKTSIGRALTNKLNIDFQDSDHEIETIANMTIPEIFTKYGEEYFRDIERKVIKRLLNKTPQILSIGGGAYMYEETRKNIKDKAISIWIYADLDVVMGRISKNKNRPLLDVPDPKNKMEQLIKERYPIYDNADIKIDNSDHQSPKITADIIIEKLVTNYANK